MSRVSRPRSRPTGSEEEADAAWDSGRPKPKKAPTATASDETTDGEAPAGFEIETEDPHVPPPPARRRVGRRCRSRCRPARAGRGGGERTRKRRRVRRTAQAQALPPRLARRAQATQARYEAPDTAAPETADELSVGSPRRRAPAATERPPRVIEPSAQDGVPEYVPMSEWIGTSTLACAAPRATGPFPGDHVAMQPQAAMVHPRLRPYRLEESSSSAIMRRLRGPLAHSDLRRRP